MSQPTPEAKLLDLIRQKSGASAKRVGIPRFFNRVFGGRVASDSSVNHSSPKWLAHAITSIRELSAIQIVNNALLALLAGLLFFVVRDTFSRSEPALHVAAEGEDASEAPSKGIRLSDLTRRNLFEPLIVAPRPMPVPVAPPAPPPPPKIPLSERAAHLRLVGIVPEGGVLQALVEDKTKQSILYVVQGESIGQFLVEKVTEDGIIIFFEDERLELRL